MTYSADAALINSGEFQQRLVACCVEQAWIYKDNADPVMSGLAEKILLDSSEAVRMRWAVGAVPVAGDLTNDADLLTAVQAAWPVYGALLQESGTP